MVLFIDLVMRVDNRFYIPDGAKGPGDYSSRGPDLYKGFMGDDLVFRKDEWVAESADEWADKVTAEVEDAFQRLQKNSKRWSFYD